MIDRNLMEWVKKEIRAYFEDAFKASLDHTALIGILSPFFSLCGEWRTNNPSAMALIPQATSLLVGEGVLQKLDHLGNTKLTEREMDIIFENDISSYKNTIMSIFRDDKAAIGNCLNGPALNIRLMQTSEVINKYAVKRAI